jgi:5'-nucleotidase
LVDATVNGVPIVQARSSGTSVETVDLGPDQTSHRVVDVLPDSLTPDPSVSAIVSDAVAKVANLVNRPVATFATDLTREGNQYALGNLMADALRAAGKGDVAVINNGGVRANVRAGAATYGSLFEVAPFANVLYRVTVNGKGLRDYFERLVARRINVHISGAKLTYDSTKTTGPRLVSAELADGRQIRDDATYTIVMTDFLVTGGDGLSLAASALKTEPLNIVDLDAIIDYVRALPQPVRAPAEPRITATAPVR